VPEKLDQYVLDSYAIFALLQKEEGEALVAGMLARARRNEIALHMSLINWGEVFYTVRREQGEEAATGLLADLARLPFSLRDVSRQRVLAAGRIKANHPVSYADAFCIALAQELDAQIVTGDPEFKKVMSFVPIRWLRPV